MLRGVLLLLATAHAASESAVSEDEMRAMRTARAKLAITFCSTHNDSQLLPCAAEQVRTSIKHLPKDQKMAKVNDAITAIEAKRKKKIFRIYHEDFLQLFQLYCAEHKATNKLCSEAAFKTFIETDPLIHANGIPDAAQASLIHDYVHGE